MATTLASAAGREMTVGGVLSRAFAAVGAAPLTFFGTGFVLFALPSLLLRLAMPGLARPYVPGTNPLAALWPGFAVGGLIWWLLYVAAKAVLIRVTVALADGFPARFGDHLAAAARAVLPLAGLTILLSLAIGFGFVLLVVPGVMLALVWAVAIPARAVEPIGVFAAFGRSAALTRGARWRILGLVVLVFAIYFIASATLGVGSVAAGGAAARGSIVSAVFSAALQTAFVAIWTAVQGALYVDLRTWKDGPAGERLADIFA